MTAVWSLAVENRPVIVLQQREKEVSSHRSITVWGGLWRRLCHTLKHMRNEQLHSNKNKRPVQMSICCSYLSETSRLALNPLFYFLSPVNRFVIDVWTQIRASCSCNTHRRISLFTDWTRELPCCKNKHLMCHKQEQHCGYALTRTSVWQRCRKNHHLQHIEPLAKTVVQRIKLCGQILSHLLGKGKGNDGNGKVMMMMIVKTQSDALILGCSRSQ